VADAAVDAAVLRTCWRIEAHGDADATRLALRRGRPAGVSECAAWRMTLQMMRCRGWARSAVVPRWCGCYTAGAATRQTCWRVRVRCVANDAADDAVPRVGAQCCGAAGAAVLLRGVGAAAWLTCSTFSGCWCRRGKSRWPHAEGPAAEQVAGEVLRLLDDSGPAGVSAQSAAWLCWLRLRAGAICLTAKGQAARTSEMALGW
jgi:hypothetical protein